MNIGVLTSGGDAPGMNAAIRAVVRRGLVRGFSIFGILNGYQGMVNGEFRPLGWHDVGGIINKGGTFLGTARSEDFKTREGRLEAVKHLLKYSIEALIVIGGDGSLMGSYILAKEWAEHVKSLGVEAGGSVLRVVGLPGSIDNDLYGTDMSIGADTALNHIVRATDDLSSTAASHQRTFVVETMGRHCGYLALMAGLAGGASWVLIPEEELDIRWHERMLASLVMARKVGRPHQMVVVAEGARHSDGLVIQSKEVCDLISRRLKVDTRLTVLGHVQRGGSPSVFDRIMATRLGVAAVDFLAENPDTTPCHMVGLVENRVVATHLDEVVNKSQGVIEELEKGNYREALDLRGSSFQKALELVKMLTRITPARECVDDRAVLVITGGADAPGMNATVSVAARCLINHGIRVAAARNTFIGLLEGNVEFLDWHELVNWVNRPSSEIGTGRIDLDDKDYEVIADVLARHKICGIIAIGGWGTYQKLHRMYELREHYPEFKIPMVLVPASIDNNLPGTEFCVGADTALNVIIDAIDKLRNTAGANRRTFIVEVMGRKCGFLALMGAMASGAEKSYLPERGISLEELVLDVQVLRESFSCGKKMLIFLINEAASVHYTTDFLRRLFEEEGKGMFGARTAVLGHIQRGGVPTAFDRILASRFGAQAAFSMKEFLDENRSEIVVLGLKGKEVSIIPFGSAIAEMDWEMGRPKNQWFMDLYEIADSLALPSAECRL